MSISEPEISRQDILVLSDPDFIRDNVCIVTGASSGIGRATAIAAAVNGLTVAGLDMDAERGEETRILARELGGEVTFINTDLASDDEVEHAVGRAAELGQVSFLANIAGIQHIDSIEDFPMEKYDLMQRIMLRAPFLLSRLCLPFMKQSRTGTGVIGNMASVHAHMTTVNKPVYNIVKFGLRGLAQSIAAEGDGKIRSFSISTGFVSTPLALNQVPAQARQRGISEEAVVSDVMMGRSRVREMMTPIEVANLFVFGFSRYSKYLVGGDLLYDGGMVLTY